MITISTILMEREKGEGQELCATVFIAVLDLAADP